MKYAASQLPVMTKIMSNSRYCDFSFYIVVLNQNFCFPWVIWQCLQTFLVVTTGGATGI